jgi:polysaccharide export outer membrane protein
LLGACASLPSSGPTGSQVLKSANLEAQTGLTLVEIDTAASLPAQTPSVVTPLPDLAPPPTDMVGPGDVLEISIYEAGVSLFGSAPAAVATSTFDPSARAHTLPPSRVDDNGYIVVPYAGRLHVAGKTIAEIQHQIRLALRGLSQNPQVVVTPRDVITNSIIVSGEVAKPGRLLLQTNRETFSDVIALAGGYRGKASELDLRVTRGQQSTQFRMNELLENPALDGRAYPGDRVALINDPRTYSILGASGKVDQVPFVRANTSLAEAVATAGGVNPNLGDPAAVFVFRYVTGDDGAARPFVYHLNMMRTGSFFLAQRFAMKDKDILYIGNARANQPSKLIQLISQLFSPLLTVTSAVQTVKLSN